MISQSSNCCVPSPCHGFGCEIYELGRIVCNVWLLAKRWHCLVVAVVRCVFAFPRLPRSAGFDRVCSLAGARRTLLSLPLPPSSYPPLLSSSALPTSLSFFLIPSFILSAHVFLGEAKRSHSSHNPPPAPTHLTPLPFSLTPSFSVYHSFPFFTPLLFFFSFIHFFVIFCAPFFPQTASLPSLLFLPFLLLSLLLCFSLSLLHSLARTGIT